MKVLKQSKKPSITCLSDRQKTGKTDMHVRFAGYLRVTRPDVLGLHLLSQSRQLTIVSINSTFLSITSSVLFRCWVPTGPTPEVSSVRRSESTIGADLDPLEFPVARQSVAGQCNEKRQVTGSR